MNEPTTPTAPSGWQLKRYFYDGQPPELDPLTSARGRSLAWCKKMATAWRASCYDRGHYELAIEPAGGWEGLAGDPLAALVYALAGGDLPPEAALAQLRAMIHGPKGS